MKKLTATPLKPAAAAAVAAAAAETVATAMATETVTNTEGKVVNEKETAASPTQINKDRTTMMTLILIKYNPQPNGQEPKPVAGATPTRVVVIQSIYN